ncbi:MAG: polyhydroxyalkanoate synthesis repressor PhaR [Gammaproteobacteria bacterium]|nr:polyhydroxyalkanoate synthesis repressor PhaR [Gammaproteobacteria bacterium]
MTMSDVRIIKKYPNRRLYDTAISSYITLEDVKRLVLDRVEFQVVDARSQEDLTRTILLQIITEQEEQGTPILTTELLEQLIRFYGDTLQGMMSSYLERSLGFFIEQQSSMRNQLQDLVTQTPLGMMSEMAERNLNMWKAMQENFLAASGMQGPARSTPKKEGDAQPKKSEK